MARPKKDNADYFSHDSDMRNDPKVKALRRNYSFKGYAIWCYLLEFLTDCDYFEIGWNDLNKELLSGDFDCEVNDLDEIVKYCVKLELLTIENNILFSYQHKKRFESLLSKRKRDRKRVIDSENPQSKVKYSKVKYSKVNKSIVEESKNFTAATEILKFLNDLPEEKITEMKELTLFSGDFEKLKQKFAVEFITRYGLNKTAAEILETLQSWMHKDKNYEKNKTNNTTGKSTKIPSDNIETKW